MAHEVAHYLGLMHPVQIDGTTPIAFDAIPDTLTCGDYYDCEDDLGQNLMYPFAGCWWGDDCEPQNNLTEQQVLMLRSNAGVR